MRINTILGALDILRRHSNTLISHSYLTHAIIGAVAGGGGGVLANTLEVWRPDWGGRGLTPHFLRKGVGWLGTTDLWSGALIGTRCLAVNALFLLYT